jgi:UDP-N-acetylmuramoyl-L-alanyl-D-glutamate--2,6-diaminopimelate ligase
MKKLLSFLKKILGPKLTRKIRPLGHGLKTYVAALRYGFPARSMTVIGINGTKGKTTTVAFMGRLANLNGIKTGYISTAVINTKGFIGQTPDVESIKKAEFLNPFKMTSIDGLVMQKYLRQMLQNGCKWVILEMSSQGLEQNRHWGLGGFNLAMFLNASPEHLEAHGGWENYLKCKSILFRNLKPGGIFLGNRHDQQTEYLWNSIAARKRPTLRKVLFGRPEDYEISDSSNGLFKILALDKKQTPTQFTADFELDNAAFALKAIQLQASRENLNQPELNLVSKLWNVPGRMELVVKNGEIVYQLLTSTNQTDPTTKVNKKINTDLTILVDYAHEPVSMRQLLETLKSWREKQFYSHVIHILSCDGVGRDDWKKPIMGLVSLELADFTILTTDNYQQGDKPVDILNLLGRDLDPNQENQKYFKMENRREAFKKALELSQSLGQTSKALIVSTGVGSEQGITQPNGKMDWDERRVWIEEFVKFSADT